MKVLVIGDSCMDEFIYGSTRMNPEAPTPVFKPEIRTNNEGMAGNVAMNAKAVLGKGHVVDLLTQDEIIVKRRFVDRNSNYILMRVDEEPEVEPMVVPLQDYIKGYDIVILSDYDKGFLTKANMAEIAKHAKMTFLDTKKALGDWCQDMDFIKINEVEYNNPAHQEDGLLLSLKDKLIVTLGSRGVRYKDEIYPVEEVEVRDVVGAGDTFHAAFAVVYWQYRYGWYVDLTHEYAIGKGLEFANKASAQVVAQKGVAWPDPTKIKMESPYKEEKES